MEEVVEPLLPELMAACARLNVNLIPDCDDSEGGYAFVDESARTPCAWDVVTKIKTEKQ